MFLTAPFKLLPPAAQIPVGTVLFSSSTPGTYNYTVDAGVASVTVNLRGADGGGGGAVIQISYFSETEYDVILIAPGLAGGAGASLVKTFSVSPGDVLVIVVGAAGPGGGYSAPGSPGGASTLTGHSLSAGGGQGGSTAAVGAGGTATGGDANTPGADGGGGAGSVGTSVGSAGVNGSASIVKAS